MIFPHAFLDSSSYWNTSHNQLQLQQVVSNTYITTPSPASPSGNNSTHPHPQEGLMATAAGGGAGDGGRGARNGDGGGSRKSKPISMPERARLARVPQPEPGLNCPRCDSTNTKFCYYNNYSLTQPRHFCRACHRYWTRGGTLRDVPASRPYRRLAKRSAKPKEATAAGATTAGTSSATLTTPSTTACTTRTAIEPSGLHYSMFGSMPTSGQLADSFNPASLARLLFTDVAHGGVHHHHHQGNGNVMEQWVAVQMKNLPFLHSMDHQIAGPPAASMASTLAELQDMFHLGLQSSGNGEDDGGHHQFHQDFTPPAKRDNQQQQQQQEEDYTSSRGMYADIFNGGVCGYNYYSSTSNASGN